MSEKIKSICFSVPYKDDPFSDEFKVEYENKPYLHDKSINGVVTIEHIDKIDIPITQIDWLIGCLQRIRAEANQPQTGEQNGE